MKYLKTFENMNDEDIFYSEISFLIEEDCEKYINMLTEYKNKIGRELKSYDIFYRGYGRIRLADEGIIEFKTRKDRIPKSTHIGSHNSVSELSKEYFGWDMRTEGVFATANKDELIYYGRKHIFLPIGDYKFLYNENVDDLTRYLHDNKIDYEYGIPDKDASVMPKKYKDVNIIKNNLRKIVSEYTDKNLDKAIEKKVEVSFKCDRYYLLNIKYEKIFIDFVNNQ